MKRKISAQLLCFCITAILGSNSLFAQKHHRAATSMVLNKQQYLEYQGVNVMLAHDFYPEGHQGGVGIIQHGQRVATNGDIRLEATPGQWAAIPKVGKRVIDAKTQEISVRME
jgi:endoglucanase